MINALEKTKQEGEYGVLGTASGLQVVGHPPQEGNT